jgi:acylphosphatase
MGRGASLTIMHVIVRGRVQGVGFRYYVREHARALRIAGWVRNLPDGSVEVLAQGSQDAVERLRAALVAGPSGARVLSVEAQGDEPVDDAMHPFGILR